MVVANPYKSRVSGLENFKKSKIKQKSVKIKDFWRSIKKRVWKPL